MFLLIGQSHREAISPLSPEYLTVDQARTVLPLSKAWFTKQRYMKAGPAYLKIGGRVLYRRADLVAYVEAHLITPAADAEAEKAA